MVFQLWNAPLAPRTCRGEQHQRDPIRVLPNLLERPRMVLSQAVSSRSSTGILNFTPSSTHHSRSQFE